MSARGRKGRSEEQQVDTRNILFIAGGAFAGLEKLLEKRLATGNRDIGLHVDLSEPDKACDQLRLFEKVQPDDLRHFGLIPEFTGRFPVITALHDLDEPALVRILTEPRNALVRQYQRLFEFEGVRLEFTPEALAAIARQAIDRGTGARGLRGVMEGLLCKVMFEPPSQQEATGCVVVAESVNGDKPPKIVLMGRPVCGQLWFYIIAVTSLGAVTRYAE